MKKIMSVTLAMLFAVLCVIPAFAASYECALTADKTRVKVGDTITVSLDVSEGCSGIQIVINYDANSLELLEKTNAGLLPIGDIGATTPGKIIVALINNGGVKAGTVASFKFKVLKLNTKIDSVIEVMTDSSDNEITTPLTNPTLTISPFGAVSSNTKITPATTAPATTKASAPVTQAPATQNNQQNNNQNNSQQPAQSGNSAASNSSANSNAQTNANTVANSTTAAPATQVATQTENTAPEVVANATEAVSENTDTLTVGATEKKSILPLIIAIAAAVISAAVIVIIILLKKREENNKEDVIGK